MSKQGSGRKSLIIGIIAAVVVLGALLAVLLTQCTGNQNATESTPVQTTAGETPTYDLYWNLDRAEYDGKSEAGMSSRQQESDGYFHIRFFYQGETVELRAADRKVINAIDVNDLMGLEFDSNGIITGVVELDDLPLEQVGWQFYVQSVGGKLLKLNSSKAFNGLEVLLDIQESTGMWDMTGLEGEVGQAITPISGDRVIAIANLAGELTHVYVYERPEYMKTFTGYCQHCEKDVEWKMWTKENSLPSDTGHYQLQNNISGMSKQQYVNEDQKVCLDLNGMTVDGKENARVYTMHFPGTQLAIMDTSEGQTGVLRGHSTGSDQGGVVWVRYGQFHFYSGTLDASDMVCKLNGTAIDIPKGAYMYMYGGKIIGGNAKAVKNDKGNWTNGIGGTMVVRGKFVMYDGIIEGGKATGVVTKYNADGTPNTYARGYAGNIYVGSGGVVEMNGGTIKGGTATHSGGNVYVDGTGEFTMNGGTITGGKVTGKGRNGGNVFITSKSTFTLKGGQVCNGVSYNCAANIYLNGKFVMTGGSVYGGKIYNWSTKKLVPTEDRANLFSVQGDFYMYGGKIDGSAYAIDTAKDNNPTIVYLNTNAVIMGKEDAQCGNLVLGSGSDGVTCRVGNLRDMAKIGITATTGIFSEPTSEANVDNFISDVDDAEVCYVDGCLALGRFSCLCGNNENGQAHYGECDGTKLFWGPLTSTTMPNATGNYYVPRVEDENGNLVPRTINCKEQSSMVEGAEIKLDLNGATLNAKKNYRFFSLHNPGTYLVITDSSEGKTGVVKTSGKGTTQGNAVWVRYGRFDLYGGTLDGSAYTLHQDWVAGTDGLFGTSDDTTSGRDGGTISMGGSTTFNMFGGTVIGNQGPRVELTKTNKITTEVDGEEVTTTEEAKKLLPSINGASLSIAGKATFNMYAGTIRDGYTEQTAGNIIMYKNAVANLYGGTISGGQAGPAYKPGTTTVEVKGWGGNIDAQAGSTINMLSEDVLITGGIAGGNGGNIRTLGVLNMQAGTITDGESLTDQGGNLFNSGTVNLTGGKITDGKAKNGGNIAINSGHDTILNGVLVENGNAGTGYGGNIRMSTTNVNGKLVIDGDTIIRNGTAGYGANLAVATNTVNKNNPVATVEINGGIIEKGNASANGANINIASSADSTATLTINGGIIREGVTGQNGGGLYASGANTEIIMNGGTFTGNVARWGGSILLSGIKGMTINGGSIENGTTIGNPSGTAGNGGNLKVDGNVPVTMNGGEIKNGKTGDFGGNVWTQGTFTLNGGTISGGEAKASSGKGGGNLYTNNANGKFYLNGGTVEGGVAGKGGSIFLNHANALCVVDGATVTGGSTTSGHGGNINSIGTVTLKSGTVKDGTAKDTAGNIYANGGTVIIEGGKVFGGNDKNGETSPQKNIYIVCTAIELRGGEIDGAVGVINYNNNNASVKMSGNPVIKSETASGLTLTWANGTGGTASKIPHINIDKPMTDGAEVYISSTKWEVGPITTATEEGYTKYFHADDEARSVGYAAGTIQLGKTHCLCGSTTETHEPGCDGTQHFWTPWASSSSLSKTSGYYYIQPSVTVTLSSQQKIDTADQKIVLDLNGRTVKNGEGKAIRGYWLAASGVEVTITDTVGGGKIVNNGSYDQGGIFWIAAGKTKVTLIKGTLDASGFTSRGTNAAGGVAVCVASADSTFTMYGGELLGGTCPNGGGAIFGSNWDSRVYIYGGEVVGNENEENPSVRLMGTKNEIENATVTGGVEINSYRFDAETTKPINQLTLKSGAKVDSILIADVADVRANGSGNYTILPLLTVNGTLTNAITISTFNEAPHVFTAAAVDASVESKFVSGSNKLILLRNTDGKLELVADNDPTFHCVCGSTGEHQQGCDGKRVRWTEWTSTNTLPITSGYYYLSKDVVLTGQQKITAADQDIYLDLNGKTVSNADGKNLRFYWISVKSNLTITDCSDTQTGVMYNDGTYAQGMIVWLGGQNAKFALFNATLDTTDAKAALTDGVPNTYATSAVCLSSAWTEFNMYSGTVNGGDAPYGGGAISVGAGSGKAYVWGGTVNGNKNETDAAIKAWGAIYLNGGTVNGGVEFNDSSDGTVSGMWISGSPKIDYIKLTDEAVDGTADDKLRLLPITIESALELEKPIKLYSFSDGVLTKTAENVTLDETALDWFFGMNHAIVLEAGQLKLVGGENVYCVCGSETETHAKGCDGTKLIWTAITDLSQIGTPGNYYLTGNMNVTAQYHFKTGETRLNLNGFTITDTSNRLFTTNGATNCVVTITDTSAGKTGGLVVKHAEGYKYAGQGHALWFNGASTLNWIAGNIDVSSTTSTKFGGNAITLEGNSTLNFYSGTITGGVSTRDASQTYSNWSEPCGGSIRIHAGSTVNMYGGTIKNGRSVGTHGGNIALFGTMNMYGGVIENGSVGQFVNGTVKTNGHGGNISLLNANAVLNIEDGEIRNGTGVQWAGNIYGYYGTLQMSGGFIYGGKIGTTAASDTANIGMRTGFVAKLSGGNISGRIAMCAYNQTGTVYLSGSINLLNRTKDSYTDDGYRLKIYPADANGTPNINLIIGELDAGTILSITNARKTDFSVNGQTVNTNVKGQFATAAEGYTLTSADVSAVKVWYVGGSSGKTPGYADTSVLKSDNTIHFENLIADSAS